MPACACGRAGGRAGRRAGGRAGACLLLPVPVPAGVAAGYFWADSACYCLLLPVTAYYCLLLPATACYCLCRQVLRLVGFGLVAVQLLAAYSSLTGLAYVAKKED